MRSKKGEWLQQAEGCDSLGPQKLYHDCQGCDSGQVLPCPRLPAADSGGWGGPAVAPRGKKTRPVQAVVSAQPTQPGWGRLYSFQEKVRTGMRRSVKGKGGGNTDTRKNSKVRTATADIITKPSPRPSPISPHQTWKKKGRLGTLEHQEWGGGQHRQTCS